MIRLDELKNVVSRLVPGFEKYSGFSIEPVYGGGNNKSYVIKADKRKYFLKHYFKHENDARNRLESEYSYSSFVWNRGISCIAQPVAKDENASIGIYSFIDGRKIQPDEIGKNEVGQAFKFLSETNRHKSTPDAASLPRASEACFSIKDHVELVGCRIDRLKAMEVANDIDRQAHGFVNNDLVNEWLELKKSIMSDIDCHKISYAEKLTPHEMVVSPSDFGFHNAIAGDDGVIRFIDFEYAGWDDPAKMVCDFFSQVAVPVPMNYFENFSGDVAGCAFNPDKTLERTRLLLPLYRIKWCCIVLNHFLPVGMGRRNFASQGSPEDKTRQLEKAMSMLNLVRAVH